MPFLLFRYGCEGIRLVEKFCLAVRHGADKILNALNGLLCAYSCKHFDVCTQVIIRARDPELAVMLGVKLCHLVDMIGTSRVDDLNALNAGEKADMINIMCLAEGVSLEDKRAVLHK